MNKPRDLVESMLVVRAVSEMQKHADEARAAGRRLVLVPTMGALHKGHLALVREGLRHGDEVVVSIFVNPAQFGPDEDFAQYPRQFDQDAARLAEISASIVLFAPATDAMYPGGDSDNLSWVEVKKLDEHLCGRFRPGHFRGVTTIVARLLHACKPHVAVFGLKDAQQFVILSRMVKDLSFDVEIVGLPTVREPNGLAYSSRNAYLTPEERAEAVVLSRAVEAARREIDGGERKARAVLAKMRSELEKAPNGRVQYVEIVDALELQPVTALGPGQDILAAVAVHFGATRLIDSVFVRVPESHS